MRLPIRKEYFDKIVSGEKKFEYRDAHITFVCEETGNKFTREVASVRLMGINQVPPELRDAKLFDDKFIICFELEGD